MAETSLLPREAQLSQPGLTAYVDLPRRHAAQGAAYASIQGACSDDRDLLLEDDLDESGKAGAASPHRRHAKPALDFREVSIPFFQGSGALAEQFVGENPVHVRQPGMPQGELRPGRLVIEHPVDAVLVREVAVQPEELFFQGVADLSTL